MQVGGVESHAMAGIDADPTTPHIGKSMIAVTTLTVFVRLIFAFALGRT